MLNSRFIRLDLLIVVVVIALCASSPAIGVTLTTETVTSGFTRPVFACSPPGDYGRFFVAEQRGSGGIASRADIRILNLKTRTINSRPFLTISPVNTGNEEGLLGLAFHPNYATNRYFFTYNTNSSGNNVVTRWSTSAVDPDSADAASGVVILTLNHPSFANHNGGWIGFGPDGYLYVATGDGGSGGDPNNNAQNLNSLLGKLLRIDVDHGLLYTIPPTNPFFGGPQQQEIFDFGLRNPWRCSFDRLTGELYIGDVGQNNWEEIDWRPSNDTGGVNFGWRLREGTHCYNPPTNCDPAGITTNPIFEYDHGLGCSVTGGYVYRGCLIPELVGTYFFADYCSGTVWSLRYNGVDTSDFRDRTAELFGVGSLGLVSFAQDNFGEVYLLRQSGQIYRIITGAPFTDCNGNHMPDSCDIAVGVSSDNDQNGIPDDCESSCGDADSSSSIDISDAVFLVAYIFGGGPAPNPLSNGDDDCSGIVDISDVVYLIAYIFTGGPAPCAGC